MLVGRKRVLRVEWRAVVAAVDRGANKRRGSRLKLGLHNLEPDDRGRA